MTITPELWSFLAKAIKSLHNCPDWLSVQARLDWHAVSELPIVDSALSGQHAIPTVEEKIVTHDYLEFLREQITLNARGAEWVTLLQDRIAAIERFAGKTLLIATFHMKPHLAILRIDSETGAVIHIETI